MTPTKSSANTNPTTTRIQQQQQSSSTNATNDEQKIINDINDINDTISSIQHNNTNTNPTETDQDMNSIQSILKPQSASLEPKDIRARPKSNTPRKVQFTVVDGVQYGGRGKTEFTRCPSRKSHTRRALPAGTFDTDSDSTQPPSDNEHCNINSKNNKKSVKLSYDITNDNGFSLLDNLNSQKFCQNSRLIKLVRRKKKRKEKEQKWLSMISPDIGLQSNKARSRIKSLNNINLNAISGGLNTNNYNVTRKSVNTQTQNQSKKLNKSVSTKSLNVNINSDRFKSPSQSMSRGRRALYKAQNAQKARGGINNNASFKKVESTPIVKGTPMVQKVTKIAMRMASLDNISEDVDTGNVADNDDDDYTMMNNGSLPPQDIITNDKNAKHNNATNKNKKKQSSELSENKEAEEMKDSSNENSPKPDEITGENPEIDRLSDEMKIDENLNGNGNEKIHKSQQNQNGLSIAYEDDEDDDLILDDLRNVTSRHNKQKKRNSNQANINSLFMPKTIADANKDDDGNDNNTKNNGNCPNKINSNAIRIEQSISPENDEAMQSKSPSHDIANASHPQQLNFNLSSPNFMGYDQKQAGNVIPESPQEIGTTKGTQCAMMSPMMFAERVSAKDSMNSGLNNHNDNDERVGMDVNQQSFSVGNNGNDLHSRSIATQTEDVKCQVGVLTDMDDMNMHNMNSFKIDSGFVIIMKNKPEIITTAAGTTFVRIIHNEDGDKNENNKEQQERQVAVDVDDKEERECMDIENDVDVVMNDGGNNDKEEQKDLSENNNDDGDKSDSANKEESDSPKKSESPSVDAVDGHKENENQNGNQNMSVSVDIADNLANDTADNMGSVSVDVEELPTSNLSPVLEQQEIDDGDKDDIVSNTTEINSNQENNDTPPPEQRLQSLSLNIQNAQDNNNTNTVTNANKNVTASNITTKNRASLKRKYNETLLAIEEENENNQLSKELLANSMNKVKRRRVNNNNNNKENGSSIQLKENRVKYQKKELIWTSHEGTDEPAIILSCNYDEKERFYPCEYEILWLNWTDSEGDRKDLCSISTVSYKDIKCRLSESDFDDQVKKGEVAKPGWMEIKRHRPDIYKKYFDSIGRRKSTKTRKIKRKRRASVM